MNVDRLNNFNGKTDRATRVLGYFVREKRAVGLKIICHPQVHLFKSVLAYLIAGNEAGSIMRKHNAGPKL